MIEGLNRALAKVEQQLTDEVDVDELARVALTSTYHLRRMFASLAGSRQRHAARFPSNPYRAVPGPEMLQMELDDERTTAHCQLWIPVEPEPTG